VPDCDFTAGESEITRAILSHLGQIPTAALLHGHPTMRDMGSFSWCAASFDDMPVDVVINMGGGEDTRAAAQVHIDTGGGAVGHWWARPVRSDDVPRPDGSGGLLKPFRDGGAASVKIASALLRWRGCLLLWDTKDRHDLDPVLLVMVIGVRSDAMLLCRYVGAVILNKEDQVNNKRAPDKSGVDEDVRQLVSIQIGGDGDDQNKRPVHARRALHVVDKCEPGVEDTTDVIIQPGIPQLSDYTATLSDDEAFDPPPVPPIPASEDGVAWYKEKSLLKQKLAEAEYKDRESHARDPPQFGAPSCRCTEAQQGSNSIPHRQRG